MAKVILRIFHRIRAFCTCSRQRDDESEISAVGTVDSVRLVYMRQIEEAASNTQQEIYQVAETRNQMSDEQQARMLKHRTQREFALEALRHALEEYELKNEKIMSKTKVPPSISSIRSNRTSPGSETYIKDVFEESHETLDTMRSSSDERGEERRHTRDYQVGFAARDLEEMSTDNSLKMARRNQYLISNGYLISVQSDVESELSDVTSDNLSELTNDS